MKEESSVNPIETGYETSSLKQEKTAHPRISISLIWPFALISAAVMLALNVWFGNLNQDEGWYLYAAQSVALGELPFRDFAFTQGPVLPYVFSCFDFFIAKEGILAGRIINAIFALGAYFWLVLLVRALTPKEWKNVASLIAFTLAAVNVYQSYFMTVVKTYSATAFFFMGGIFFLHKTMKSRAMFASILAGFFLATATATRLSAGIALPIAGIALLFLLKRIGISNALTFGISGLATLSAWFLPLYLSAPESFIFGLIEYHREREVDGNIMLKAGFISRVVQAYFIGIVLCFILILERLCFKRKEKKKENNLFLLWLIVIGITGLHFLSPFPYDDYQTFVYPLFAALVSVGVVNYLISFPHRRGLACLTLLLVCIAACFSSPINSDWFVIGRDRVWWKIKPSSDLSVLRKTAKKLKEIKSNAKQVLTQDTYLAAESGLRVPKGLEMGVFSYYPLLSSEKCAVYKVLNKELLLNLIESTQAPVAAISGYGFSVISPEVKKLEAKEQQLFLKQLESYYRPHTQVRHFGQGHTTLILYERIKK